MFSQSIGQIKNLWSVAEALEAALKDTLKCFKQF